MHKLILPGERPMSWNKMYAGSHWSKRMAEVMRVGFVIRSQLAGDEQPYTVPVDIRITAYFDTKPLDASNIAAKLYEDALKDWLLVDDTPAYVASMTTASRIDKDNPRVEIEIREAVG
jgi:Holliday junction resolvase RusA-like endonuclease